MWEIESINFKTRAAGGKEIGYLSSRSEAGIKVCLGSLRAGLLGSEEDTVGKAFQETVGACRTNVGVIFQIRTQLEHFFEGRLVDYFLAGRVDYHGTFWKRTDKFLAYRAFRLGRGRNMD